MKTTLAFKTIPNKNYKNENFKIFMKTENTKNNYILSKWYTIMLLTNLENFSKSSDYFIL